MFGINSLILNSRSKSHAFRPYCKKVAKSKAGSSKITHVGTFGQPTHKTHPHLIAKDEVTPSITKTEYQTRRQKLLDSVTAYVSKKNPDIKRHLILIPSGSKQYMSDKIPYVFRQNTEFSYLVGCQEPDSCLVLTASTDTVPRNCVTLFVREKDDHSELWDGPRTGPEKAQEIFGVDQSLPMSELENYLQLYLRSNTASTLWYDYTTPVQTSVHKVMCDYLNNRSQKFWESPKGFIQKQRLIKSPAEISLMKKSCDIASEAIAKTIKDSKPGISEHQIFAKVDYECRMNGAEFLAYPPVVAGGDRANIIHYINNNQIVRGGEMVLMDAGCEYHGYSSDITRTWPINGRFNTQQRELYDIVLHVQNELIKLCSTFPTLDSLFNSMCILLGKGLQEIGLLPKMNNQDLMKSAYQFCPHHVSHYLGMDVHDTPLVMRNIQIQPGMIITVEPGIYINHKHSQVPKEFRGIGVRIEDDVLITENGPIVLTKNCPKEVHDIENLARKNIS